MVCSTAVETTFSFNRSIHFGLFGGFVWIKRRSLEIASSSVKFSHLIFSLRNKTSGSLFASALSLFNAAISCRRSCILFPVLSWCDILSCV